MGEKDKLPFDLFGLPVFLSSGNSAGRKRRLMNRAIEIKIEELSERVARFEKPPGGQNIETIFAGEPEGDYSKLSAGSDTKLPVRTGNTNNPWRIGDAQFEMGRVDGKRFLVIYQDTSDVPNITRWEDGQDPSYILEVMQSAAYERGLLWASYLIDCAKTGKDIIGILGEEVDVALIIRRAGAELNVIERMRDLEIWLDEEKKGNFF